jgi:hypothetical protein
MLVLSLVALMVAVVLPAGAATAQEEVVKVKVSPTAKVLDDGRAVEGQGRWGN